MTAVPDFDVNCYGPEKGSPAGAVTFVRYPIVQTPRDYIDGLDPETVTDTSRPLEEWTSDDATLVAGIVDEWLRVDTLNRDRIQARFLDMLAQRAKAEVGG